MFYHHFGGSCYLHHQNRSQFYPEDKGSKFLPTELHDTISQKPTELIHNFYSTSKSARCCPCIIHSHKKGCLINLQQQKYFGLPPYPSNNPVIVTISLFSPSHYDRDPIVTIQWEEMMWEGVINSLGSDPNAQFLLFI
jgi:hypothetical protein